MKSIRLKIVAVVSVLLQSITHAFHTHPTYYKSTPSTFKIPTFLYSAIDDVSPSDFFAAALNGIEVNGDAVDLSILASKKEYDLALDFFMFELGTDIIFLDDNKEISDYINRSFDTVIFQCKGVLMRKEEDGKAIRGASEAVRSLMDSNKSVLFLGDSDSHEKNRLEQLLNLNSLNDEQIISSVESLSRNLNINLNRTLMVVDRLDYNINSYKQLGVKISLVLSGSTNAQNLIDASMVPDDQPFPHMIIPHVGMMTNMH